MKSIFALIIFCAALQGCSSQSRSIRIYGYKQAVGAGRPSTYQTDEQGKPSASVNRPRLNYLIYMSHPAGIIVQPVEAWINGEVFGLRKDSVKAPVERLLDSSPMQKEKLVLVPETRGSVWMLTPIAKEDSSFALKKTDLPEKNELVLVYRLNDRYAWKEIKTLKVLRTEVMQ